MNRRDLLKHGLGCGAALLAGTSALSMSKSLAAGTLPRGARFDKLPQWRGFNLLEKFNGQNKRFVEDDFRWISDFGFDFVRLPMDYRMWIKDNDWRKINEKVLEDIDEAVRFGEKYGIHVCMNFHRAPGHTVASPPEAKSVWTDPEALEVCTLHWKTFAKRYKGISNDQVSFNLFNEPFGVEKILDRCVAAHKHIIKGIREEDPDRLVICDGHEWGTKPFFDLVEDKIAQATRGYAPHELSHYGATWAGGDKFSVPTWPIVAGNGFLHSPGQGGIADDVKGASLVIEGPFTGKTRLRFKVWNVSGDTSMSVTADGKTIFERNFKPGPGEGEWEKVVYLEQWKIYQNVYNRDYMVDIPAGTKKVELRATAGQWLSLKEIGIRGEHHGKETVAKMIGGWGQKPAEFAYHDSQDGAALSGGNGMDKKWLRDRLEPWKELQKKGSGVIVGEFGAFSPVPHDVAIRWMSDMVANWREAGWGYALWNFRGDFGILDSGRKDVDYEDFHGHKLDRKMLAVLQGK